jgi:hypothetical protein
MSIECIPNRRGWGAAHAALLARYPANVRGSGNMSLASRGNRIVNRREEAERSVQHEGNAQVA